MIWQLGEYDQLVDAGAKLTIATDNMPADMVLLEMRRPTRVGMEEISQQSAAAAEAQKPSL